MSDAARIGMLGLDAQADDERAVVVLAIEERPVVLEERAGAEERLEALGGSLVSVMSLVIPSAAREPLLMASKVPRCARDDNHCLQDDITPCAAPP